MERSRTMPELLLGCIDLFLDVVMLVDAHGQIVYVNGACEKVFGYRPDEMIGAKMLNHVVPEDRAKTWEESLLVMSGVPRIGFENRYIRKDGSHVHIMWSARWSDADQLRIGIARDVTELKRTEELQSATYAISEAAQRCTDLQSLYREVHRIIADLVPAASFAVAAWDAKNFRLNFPYHLDMHGETSMAEHAEVQEICLNIVHSGRPVLVPAGGSAVSEGQALSRIGMPLVVRQEVIGALFLKSYPGTCYNQKDTELLQFVAGQVAVAVENRRLSTELLHAARYDELTGLPNRRYFHEQLPAALLRTQRSHQKAALIYIDLDGFKYINDTLGHAAGDQLLYEFAQRLKQLVRGSDLVARLGGDEFVVLLEQVNAIDTASLLIEKLLRAADEPVILDGGIQVTVRPSIGVAYYPEHGYKPEQLLMKADQAMYANKRQRATESK